MLIMSTMITLSSNNLMSMWMGMEINSMMFLPILSNKMNNDSMLIYFLIQSISSVIFLTTMLLNKMMLPSTLLINMMTLSLMMKLGTVPFHKWIIMIMSKMSWLNCNILMTWQKLIPLSILHNITNNYFMMLLIIIMSITLGALGGILQTTFRKIMAYSSINHLGWMLSTISTQLWNNYFILYSITTTLSCYLFHKLNLLSINQMNINKNENITNMVIFINMMSMGGLPPLLGFLPKLIVFNWMYLSMNLMLITIMMFMSLLTLLYYMYMSLLLMLTKTINLKWNKYFYKNTWSMMLLMMNISLPLMLLYN
uniref:NADH-ubiquinone oxidoreductase chain 2 n=1 Tax=Megaris sp. TaxID=2931300 RepID=A0A8T9ZW32_9HEMI|nr:NADH dehydrogenase subunit 2 [Megaris sp.]